MPIAKAPEYRIIKRSGAKVEYLRHEGHSHYWTTKKEDAMVYTRLSVAVELCKQKFGSEVVAADGSVAFPTS